MGNQTSIEDLPVADFAEQEENKKTIRQICQDTFVLFFNIDYDMWSRGIVSRIIGDDIYVLCENFNTTHKFNRNSQALRLDFRLFDYEKYVQKGKMTDSINIHPGKGNTDKRIFCCTYVNMSNHISQKFSDIFDKSPKITIIPNDFKINYMGKVKLIILNRFTEGYMRSYHLPGYINGIDMNNIYVLSYHIDSNSKVTIATYVFPKKHSKFIIPVRDEEPQLELFSTVKRTKDNIYTYISDIYNDKYIDGEGNISTKDQLELLKFPYEKAKPYLDGTTIIPKKIPYD